MKKVEFEDAISEYAGRKRYIDVDEDIGDYFIENSECCVERATLMSALTVRTRQCHSLLFSKSIASLSAFISEFKSLQQFLLLWEEPVQVSLLFAYCQLVFKTFIQLLETSNPTEAQAFLVQLSDYLKPAYSDRLKLLLGCCNVADVERHQELNYLQNKTEKIVLCLPGAHLKILLTFLHDRKCVFILELIKFYFVLQDFSEQRMIEVSKSHITSSPSQSADSRGQDKTSGKASLHLSISEKQFFNSCTKTVRGMAATSCLPTVALCCSTSRSSVACQFSPSATELFVSHGNSGIVVYNMTDNLSDVQRMQLSSLCSDHSLDITDHLLTSSIDDTATLQGHTGDVFDMCFGPAGEYLLSASADTTVRLWDMQSYSCRVAYQGHSESVWSVHCSTHYHWFVSGSLDRSAKLWSTDRLYPLRIFLGHELDVTCVRFHPNGNYVGTSSADCTVRVWSVQDGKCVRLLHGHTAPVSCIAFSPDGRHLCSAGKDATLNIWDIGSGSIVSSIECDAQVVTFNKHGSLIVTGNHQGNINLWNMKSLLSFPNQERQQQLCQPIASYMSYAAIQHLYFNTDNVLLAAGYKHNNVQVLTEF